MLSFFCKVNLPTGISKVTLTLNQWQIGTDLTEQGHCLFFHHSEISYSCAERHPANKQASEIYHCDR